MCLFVCPCPCFTICICLPIRIYDHFYAGRKVLCSSHKKQASITAFRGCLAFTNSQLWMEFIQSLAGLGSKSIKLLGPPDLLTVVSCKIRTKCIKLSKQLHTILRSFAALAMDKLSSLLVWRKFHKFLRFDWSLKCLSNRCMAVNPSVQRRSFEIGWTGFFLCFIVQRAQFN